MKKTFYIVVFLFFGFLIISGVFADGGMHDHQSNDRFNFGSIIVPLGITTLICLVTTLTLGLLMPKGRKFLLPWHKRMAFITLILALAHGAMALIFHSG